MKRGLYSLALILVLVPMILLSVDTKDTRLLRDPGRFWVIAISPGGHFTLLPHHGQERRAIGNAPRSPR